MVNAGRLQTDARLIEDLVEDVKQGGIRIPSFQRGLRWQRSDVVKLFDSVVRGYPIGNLLLWRRRAPRDERLRIGALRIDAPERDAALYVVDGQQRLTSLANALTDEGHSDPRFALAYDVNTERFIESTGNSPFEIPLPVLFDLARLLQWFATRPAIASDAKLVERANKIAKSLKDFRVPVYVVEQSDESVLRDIFDRMNNYGRKLTRAEVFSALNDSTSQDGEGENLVKDLESIAAEVHQQTGFGLIDEPTLLLAMLARRNPNISRDIRGEFEKAGDPSASLFDFPSETAAEAREALVESLVRAVVFLQKDAAMPHFSFLPYRYLLVVLARFFAHFPSPSSGTARNLRRWFWRAAVLGPQVTRGNITSVTRAMCRRVVPGAADASVSGLLEMLEGFANTSVQVTAFRTNQAATRILLAAIWDLGPMWLDEADSLHAVRFDLETLVLALGESSSARSVVPLLSESEDLSESLRNRPGNRVMWPISDVPLDSPFSAFQIILNQSDLDSAQIDKLLASHAISGSTIVALKNGRVDEVVAGRDLAFAAQLASFVERQTEWKFEDTPSLDALTVPDLDEPRDDELTADVL